MTEIIMNITRTGISFAIKWERVFWIIGILTLFGVHTIMTDISIRRGDEQVRMDIRTVEQKCLEAKGK